MQLFIPSSYRDIHKKAYENPNKANHADSLQKGINSSAHLAPKVKFNGGFDFFSSLKSTPAEREGLLATQKKAESEKDKKLRTEYRRTTPIYYRTESGGVRRQTFEEFKANEERHEQSLLEAHREVEEEREKRRKERQAIIKQREAERDNPQ